MLGKPIKCRCLLGIRENKEEIPGEAWSYPSSSRYSCQPLKIHSHSPATCSHQPYNSHTSFSQKDSDSRIFQESILCTQFLYLLTSGKTLKSFMVILQWLICNPYKQRVLEFEVSSPPPLKSSLFQDHELLISIFLTYMINK